MLRCPVARAPRVSLRGDLETPFVLVKHFVVFAWAATGVGRWATEGIGQQRYQSW